MGYYMGGWRVGLGYYMGGWRNSSMGRWIKVSIVDGWIGRWMEGRKEMFYLTTHSTHFIYGYMASDIW